MLSVPTVFIAALMVFTLTVAQAEQSTCYGSPGNGRLERGVELPERGSNFMSYSELAGWLGRTFVHSTVRDVIVESYRLLAVEQPIKMFKYAETGYKDGGRFRPHKTHQNGLSVDFTVPVVDASGISVQLPTDVFNKFGYAVEFDADGRYKNYRIDFTALAAHIVALHKTALKNGVAVGRVIFDPGLQPKLYATQYGSYLKQHIVIPGKRSWVRHDDHYHVDFAVECKPME